MFTTFDMDSMRAHRKFGGSRLPLKSFRRRAGLIVGATMTNRTTHLALTVAYVASIRVAGQRVDHPVDVQADFDNIADRIGNTGVAISAGETG